MRWAIGLGSLLCACNQAFGVKDTRQVDARYFDAPVDAAWGCPPLGQRPVLAPELHQDVLQWCDDYSVAGDRAVAVCHDAVQASIYEGTLHQSLTLAPGVLQSSGEEVYDQPRLSSDGHEMYVRHFNYSTNLEDTVMYTRGSDGTWVAGAPPPFGRNINDNLSTIVAGATGDRIFVMPGAGPTFEEWVHEAGGWRDAGSSTLTGILPTQPTSVNPIDPLRAIVIGYDRHAYYVDRPDPGSPFRTAMAIPEIPEYAFDAAMTPDCGRVYVTGLRSVFYVQQP